MTENSEASTELQNRYPDLVQLKSQLRASETSTAESEDQGVKSKEVDIFKEIKAGNFLPIISLCKSGKCVKLQKMDIDGFTVVHYAVCYGNHQVILS